MIWTAFILGLVGSVHCVGMCGPLALAVPFASCQESRQNLARVLYNVGRIVTYALIGAIVGALGQAFVLPGLQRWISVGGGLLIIALFASSRPSVLRTPLTQGVDRLKRLFASLLAKRSLRSVFALGLLNGLLPCGLVYVAAAAAAASAHPVDGFCQMAAFGFGTTPAMLLATFSGKVLPMQLRFRIQRLTPLLGILFGSLLILRGMDLGIPYLSPKVGAANACCLPPSPTHDATFEPAAK